MVGRRRRIIGEEAKIGRFGLFSSPGEQGINGYGCAAQPLSDRFLIVGNLGEDVMW